MSRPGAPEAAPPRRFPLARRTSLVLVGAMALFETIKDLLLAGTDAYAMLGRTVFQNLAWWAPWMVLGPLVAMVCRRFSFFEGARFRAAVAHTVSAIAVGLAHTLVTSFVFSLAPRDPAAWPGILPIAASLAQGYLVLDMVTYGAMVAALHVTEYAAALRRQEKEKAALALKASELERALTTAKLDALQAQLNPHFLFNTLNSIAGLVRQGEREQAVTTIARLGELLRESLATETGALIELGHELAIVDRYVAIEEVRFHGRLAVGIDVAPLAERAQVPVLLLQPLVENAIRHGIAKWPEGGRVSISAAVTDDNLGIEVVNRPLVARPVDNGKALREGIGLRNTRERLAQHYGQRARLDLEFLEDGGCRVSVQLPFEEARR